MKTALDGFVDLLLARLEKPVDGPEPARKPCLCECGEPVHANGLCLRCSIEARIERRDRCHVWTGQKSGTTGYGYVIVNGRRRQVHRLLWELAYGPLDPRLHTLHLCDRRDCVRLTHLAVGPPGSNATHARLNGLYRSNDGRTMAERREELVATYRNTVLADLLDLAADILAAEHSTEKEGIES